MLNDHLRLMSVFAESGEITGRKKLQKMIFIAKKMAFPFQEKFEFHFYGPYSEELTLRVEELCNFGFIEEKKEDKGGYCQYTYNISDAGREFIDSYQQEMPRLKECLTNMNGQNARFLELVSTILYFDQESKAEVTEKIQTLKSKQGYTCEEIDHAYAYIDELKKTAVL
ncbi:YwgA family protein [Lederbergia citrea]|uniref:YwgA family protein n=1 Tax=Lederbergia citrea TaxID=2833581 RepID=A0A942UR27_9BACI|nr:YwgA family protein [Lederbergia citrea]MBS4178005.1 YwgA family protein [Lederbergia citrea]MBS4223481.1 YwgA family protein [Lederbergia citrea]